MLSCQGFTPSTPFFMFFCQIFATMKIPELREKLSGLSEKELVYLAIEFYKLIPKAKREMYQLDAMTEAPDPASKPSKLQGSTDSIADMEHKIKEFVHNAEAGYYFRNNREVSRKERRTWRSKVKSWHKALTSMNRPDADLDKQADLLIRLYGVLQKGREYTLFSSQEPFSAINVEQSAFYKSILDLYDALSGKEEVIKRGTRLLIEPPVSSYTVSYLIDEFLLLISIPDLYEKTIDRAEALLTEIHDEDSLTPKVAKLRYDYDSNLKRKVNAMAELGLRVYLRLGEYTNGLSFFDRHYMESNSEIKLYILVNYLHKEGKPDLIRQAINAAKMNGIKPRNSLLDLDQYIEINGVLPERFS